MPTITGPAIEQAAGKTIRAIELLKYNALVLHFPGSDALSLVDWDQQCCEIRYMTTDDNLAAFVGAAFLGAETRYVGYRQGAPDDKDYDDDHQEHEIAFLLVHTSLGTFTLESHNRHNGYYEGFQIEALSKAPGGDLCLTF